VQDTVVVHEIYLSVQGESSWAGWPCVFVRLSACDLRCSYCDTAYAFTGGKRHALADVCAEVRKAAAPYTASPARSRLPLVELTGGEPLIQPGSIPLMTRFCDEGFTVLLETSGAHDISPVDGRVHRIMDLKCPSSGEAGRNRWSNIGLLQPRDEVKFVIGTHEDYAWAREQLLAHRLAERCTILFSGVSPLTVAQTDTRLKAVPPGHRPMSRQELAEQIMADGLPVRFQLQLHKLIWPPDQRGV
jgi:7-carboxy-7-deazaguanine synthase